MISQSILFRQKYIRWQKNESKEPKFFQGGISQTYPTPLDRKLQYG